MQREYRRISFTERLLAGAAFFIFIFIVTVLGGSLLKFMGMEYRSFWDVFLFFTIYFILNAIVSLLLKVLLMPVYGFLASVLLGSGDEKQPVRGRLFYRIDLAMNFGISLVLASLLMLLIDSFMTVLYVPFRAVAAFAVIFCLLDLIFTQRGAERPVRIYLYEKKPEQSVESRELLHEVIAMYCADYGMDFGGGKDKIAEGEHGKPVLLAIRNGEWVPRTDIYFSVTHTKNWWLCAVYHSPIGVDMEELGRAISPAAAERVFTAGEQAWLSRVGTTADHLLELWVRKEAYVKYLGFGISAGLQNFSVAGEEGLLPHIGEGEREAVCGSLFPETIRDTEGFPVPLVGAFCTSCEPAGFEIGFMEKQDRN